MGRLTRSRSAPALVTAVATLLLGACGQSAPDVSEEAGVAESPTDEGQPTASTYERNFVFAALDGDSLFMVPWLLKTVAQPDTVSREARGWISRSGIWDAFYAEQWTTPPTREPARVLPHGDLSFVVREGDAIDGIVFEQPGRSLELVLGEVTATWVGPRGETFELLDGAAYISDQRVEGTVLDMGRASPDATVPGGDWAFLLAGDSARFVIAGDQEHGGELESIYRGWGSLDSTVLQWSEIEIAWTEAQAFPPARRDVPVRWSVSSTDRMIEGELSAVSADIQAGTGPGPLLPVRALFEVEGQLSTVEGRFPVRGLLVHERR